MLVAAVAGVIGLTGCIPRRTAESAPTPTPTAPLAEGPAPVFTLSALPAFRLVPDEFLLDVPSRLLVIQIYMTTAEDSTLQFSVKDFTLLLPNGVQARVLDRPRALEVLRRTMLAEAKFDYLDQGGQPGGLSGFSPQRLRDVVAGNLLSENTFGAGESLNGYVVVDTGTAFRSLEGGSVEVVVYRLSDSAGGRNAYQFAAAAQPTPAPEAQ